MFKRSSYSRSLQPRRGKGCSGVFYLLVLLLLAGVAIWYFYVAERKAADVAPAIVAFTGEADLRVKQGERKDAQFGAIQTYSAQLSGGDPVTFDIDRNTGQIVGFFRSKQTSLETRIDQQQALQIAMDFGVMRYQDPGLLVSSPLESKLLSNGNTNYYFFSWVKVDPATGAFLPQAVKIQVNAQTGQVDSYYAVFQNVTIPLTPQIERGAAEQIALGAVTNFPGVQIRESILTVSTVPINQPGGQQTLIWLVTLQGASDNGYAPGLVVYIDAMTGTILFMEPVA